MEKETQFVRFENNNSKRWDGKERGIPAETVVRTGKGGADGLEEAEVHWLGKGGKGTAIWNCVILGRTWREAVAKDGVVEGKKRRYKGSTCIYIHVHDEKA